MDAEDVAVANGQTIFQRQQMFRTCFPEHTTRVGKIWQDTLDAEACYAQYPDMQTESLAVTEAKKVIQAARAPLDGVD